MRSLSVQLFGGVLLSLLVAAAAFILFFSFGNFLLDHTVYGQGFAARMSRRAFAQLEDYVTQEAITPQKLRRLNAWCASRNDVFLSLYRDDRLIFEPSFMGCADGGEAEEDPDIESAGQRFELTLADGTAVEAYIYYFADEAFFIWMCAVSGALAFIVFSLCFTSLVHRKLRYIQKLKKELDILAGGDLEYVVTVRGTDEQGELALGIDRMRRSILGHQRAENEIRAANSQLVTAMSHDLRTPLTSLMAYLELLDRDKVPDEAQKKRLIHQCLSKAESIKDMADKLFEYFLVYTSEWEAPDMERVDADTFMRQFWQEYAFALESRGFEVHTGFGVLGGALEVCPSLMQRAFDNMYANLLKYADAGQPIDIRCYSQGREARLAIVNGIASNEKSVQSTNIGLNTCRRILAMHDGSFRAYRDGTLFRVEMSIPLKDAREG